MEKYKQHEKKIIVLLGFYIIFVHYQIFSTLLPNYKGKLGHDFAGGLPALLDGFFWCKVNGFFSIPWFSPYLGGGIPVFPHPANISYTIPQFLTYWVDPLTSMKLTFILFGALGFWGFYCLLRKFTAATVPIAFLAATLFLFNGFYAYRFVIGHFGFHSFMLIPWAAYFLLCGSANQGSGFTDRTFKVVMAGLIITYMFYSSAQLVLAEILSIFILCLILKLTTPRSFNFKYLIVALLCAGLLSAVLSIARLVATFAFMGNIPRTQLPLPGIQNLTDLISLWMQSLFIKPALGLAEKVIINITYYLDRHEFEYGITIVPLLVLCLGLGANTPRLFKKKIGEIFIFKEWLLFGLTVLLFLTPLALNYYTPAWNRLIKSIPVLKSYSSFFRWFCVYIPVIILMASITIEKTPILIKHHFLLSVLGIIAVIILNMTADRRFYNGQPYDPGEIIQAYHEVQQNQRLPQIVAIGVYVDESGRIRLPGFRNNSLVHKLSQLYLYDSIFGYHLENFPFKTLHPGPVLEEKNGVLNIKNPACYVWPEANDCQPGDHFTVQQKAAAEAFANYRPFPFKMPLKQKVANGVNALGLAAVLIFLIVYGAGQAIAFTRKSNKIQ